LDGGVEFETQAGQDVRPEVARAVVTTGFDLLELKPLGVSLEEIFLQLTRDEPEPPMVEGEEELDSESDSEKEEEQV
jgi:hypothetical protein